MQTIKTFVVVGLLLAVCYGAFVALNAPEVSIPEELEQWAQSTNDKALQDFEIPTLSVPDQFSNQVNPPAFTQNSIQSGSSLPQFPSEDLSASSSQPFPNVKLDVPEITGQSLGTAASLPTTSVGPSDFSNLPLPSGATLTSVPVATSVPVYPESNSENFLKSGNNQVASPLGGDPDQHPIPELPGFSTSGTTDGPSIPLNTQSSLNDREVEDLIGAIGQPDAVSTDNFADSSRNELADSMRDRGLNPDPGFLASRSNPSPEVSAESVNPQQDATPQPYSEARTLALQLAESGELTKALEMLSSYYESPELDYAEHTDLVDILDALAREVIYSDRPLLKPKHLISAQDTLTSLAESHRLNPELIAAMNNMGQSQALVANTEIKLIDGPFRAQVSLARGELTLFLRKLYAGRFPVSISQKNKPEPGMYEIVDRRRDRTFYSANAVVPAEDPKNPYGGYWLSLGGNMSIHGSPEQITSELEGAGSISLAPLDAADIYRILGKGSAVEIRP